MPFVPSSWPTIASWSAGCSRRSQRASVGPRSQPMRPKLPCRALGAYDSAVIRLVQSGAGAALGSGSVRPEKGSSRGGW